MSTLFSRGPLYTTTAPISSAGGTSPPPPPPPNNSNNAPPSKPTFPSRRPRKIPNKKQCENCLMRHRPCDGAEPRCSECASRGRDPSLCNYIPGNPSRDTFKGVYPGGYTQWVLDDAEAVRAFVEGTGTGAGTGGVSGGSDSGSRSGGRPQSNNSSPPVSASPSTQRQPPTSINTAPPAWNMPTRISISSGSGSGSGSSNRGTSQQASPPPIQQHAPASSARPAPQPQPQPQQQQQRDSNAPIQPTWDNRAGNPYYTQQPDTNDPAQIPPGHETAEEAMDQIDAANEYIRGLYAAERENWRRRGGGR